MIFEDHCVVVRRRRIEQLFASPTRGQMQCDFRVRTSHFSKTKVVLALNLACLFSEFGVRTKPFFLYPQPPLCFCNVRRLRNLLELN